MSEEQFAAIMPYISADLIKMIIAKQGLPELEATKLLYGSKLYTILENEQSKVWHYSTDMLYSLLVQEQQTGSITFPDI